MQKFRILGFFFENRLTLAFCKFRCYYLHYVPASKSFDYAWFEVIEAITLVLDPITGNFKASYFCRILNKFTGRAKPIRIIGNSDNQRPDKRSSTVLPKDQWQRRWCRDEATGCTREETCLIFPAKKRNFSLLRNVHTFSNHLYRTDWKLCLSKI
jgi:hypothetical protein